MPLLANLLPLLPNLKTLEVHTGDYPDPDAERSFEPVKLPQIHMLFIEPCTHYLMKCCTNSKVVAVLQQGLDDRCLKSIPFAADSGVSCLAFSFAQPYKRCECSLLLSSICNSNQRLDLVQLCPNLEKFGIIQVSGSPGSILPFTCSKAMQPRFLEIADCN